MNVGNSKGYSSGIGWTRKQGKVLGEGERSALRDESEERVNMRGVWAIDNKVEE